MGGEPVSDYAPAPKGTPPVAGHGAASVIETEHARRKHAGGRDQRTYAYVDNI